MEESKRPLADETPEEAILVSLDTGEFDVEISLDELEELARTAGARVTGRLIQKREAPDKATCIGSGRLEELREVCENTGVDLVIFDLELSATQHRNLTDALPCRVVDRTTLILDIFAARARSAEGRLQVELAQLEYLLPRLAGQGTALSRLGGGIGTRGPGETKLESDRRHIRRRIHALKEQLEAVENRREHRRARRRKDGVCTVAIVGYTNAGKSTLLNTLTDAGVLAEDKLFATLDPTSRALKLPDGREVLLVDTVGFVRRLPHHLVKAFRSTLEEAVERSVGKPAAAFGLVEGARVAVAGALSRGRRTLIVAPPHIGENLPDTGLIENFGVQAIETSHGFAKEFLKISRIQKADFLDAAQFCAPSQRDAVHLTAQGHLALAEGLAAKVRAMLAEQ